jgi:hypothetical protein
MFRYVREPTDMNLKGRSVKASILLEPRLLINDERLHSVLFDKFDPNRNRIEPSIVRKLLRIRRKLVAGAA